MNIKIGFLLFSYFMYVLLTGFENLFTLSLSLLSGILIQQKIRDILLKRGNYIFFL